MGGSGDPAKAVKPRVFIGSSSEFGEYAEAAKRILEEGRTLSVTYWRDVFGAAGPQTAIEIITRAAEEEFNFAVFILSPDDIRTLRGETSPVPRDNVIFEMGLFIGALGRECVFLITPDKRESKLPGDLGGLNIDTWITDEENVDSAIRSSASNFRSIITKRWRERSMVHSGVGGRLASSQTTESDDNDTWLQAYKAGALEQLDPGQVGIGDRIVHADWGLGLVTEVGPWGGGSRYLTVEFPHGPATVLSNRVAMQKFVKSD